jgi:hypothetical protein
MDNKLKQQGDTVVLCCTLWMPCCPTVKKESGNFTIADDFGGEILLTESNMETVLQLINETVSLPGDSLDN